jgi:hypothetical protein
MRNKGTISHEVMRRLENELDLEETRLILERAVNRQASKIKRKKSRFALCLTQSTK